MLDWMPEQASTWASRVDSLNNFITYTSAFCTVAITAVMLYFAVKYRKKSENQQTSGPDHSFLLETLWTAIPTVVVIYVFFAGFNLYHEMRVPPSSAMEISVEGYQWGWNFVYPNGKRSGKDLVVPLGEPVRLLMKSRDVNHSFFIPAMRIKEDLLASQYTYTWFTPNKLGNYHIFCTEYCGTQHSAMRGTLRVVSKEQYEDFLLDRSDTVLPPAELGKELYKSMGCDACHSLDGNRLIGPPLNATFGSSRDFSDGTKAIADENYLRESILNPSAKVVAGYPPAMPAYEGRLTDEETAALLAFLKSFSLVEPSENTTDVRNEISE